MLIGFRDSQVRAAAAPAVVARASGTASQDLAVVLTTLTRAPSLAHLLSLRSMSLTRLEDEPVSDYHFGTPTTGVTFRPVDPRGRTLQTTHTKESLMTVTAVTIQEIGQPREEARTA